MGATPDEKVDWFRVIVDLERSGYSHCAIATVCDVAKRTVGGWKQGSSPKFDDGVLLLSLWESVTGNGQDSAPRVKRYSHHA